MAGVIFIFTQDRFDNSGRIHHLKNKALMLHLKLHERVNELVAFEIRTGFSVGYTLLNNHSIKELDSLAYKDFIDLLSRRISQVRRVSKESGDGFHKQPANHSNTSSIAAEIDNLHTQIATDQVPQNPCGFGSVQDNEHIARLYYELVIYLHPDLAGNPDDLPPYYISWANSMLKAGNLSQLKHVYILVRDNFRLLVLDNQATSMALVSLVNKLTIAAEKLSIALESNSPMRPEAKESEPIAYTGPIEILTQARGTLH